MRTAGLVVAYLAALSLGLWEAHRPVFESRFALMQTDLTDGMLNQYLLEHSWQVLTNPKYPGTLSSPPFFFPHRHTLWYSEHLLGTAPVYWVLRVALPPDLAYQWWQIAFAVANFAACALVVRWLGQPHVLAILGGYLWAFAVVHIDQLRHTQLIPRVWMPLAVYHAWVFALAPGARPLNRMLACAFLQWVTCVNTGWFLVMGLATFLPLAVGLRPGGWADLKRWYLAERPRALRVVLLWGAAMAAAFAPYALVNWGLVRAYTDSLGLIPTPAAWLTGPPGSRWYELLGRHWDYDPTGMDDPVLVSGRAWVYHDSRLFCGFGLYAMMLAAAVHLIVFRRAERPALAPFVAAGLLTAAVWFLLTLSAWNGGPCAWYYVRALPGGAAVRCVSRVYVLVYLFGTLAALAWLGAVTANLRPRVRWAVLGAVAAVVIFEQTGVDLPAHPKADFYPAADRVAEQLRGAEAGYVIPRYTDASGTVRRFADAEVMAMWAGLRAGVPVVNGYSGRFPGKEQRYPGTLDDDQLRAWLAGKFRGKLTVVDPDNPAARHVLVIE